MKVYRPAELSLKFHLSDVSSFTSHLYYGNLVLPSILACILALCLPRIFRRPSTFVRQLSHSMPLSCFLVPSKSALWPKNYLQLCRSSDQITLPLLNVLHDVLSGIIEIRRPEAFLDIFRGNLELSGRKIKLEAGPSLHLRVMKWLFRSQASFHGARPNTHDLVPVMRKSPTLFLDIIPNQKINKILQKYISSTDTDAAIEFTTISPDISFLSNEFILTAVPFLPPVHRSPTHHHASPTPLFLSFSRVVEAIYFMNPPITIKTIRNVSDLHSQTLKHMEGALIEDRECRSRFIEQYGVEAWREHRFMLTYEAALHDASFLSRWVIVVQK